MQLQKAALLAEADAIIKKQPFSKEDSSKVDALLRLAEALTPVETRDEIRKAQPQGRYDRAFYSWLRSGSPEKAMELRSIYLQELGESRYTPQTTVIDGSGGELTPQGFEVAVQEVMRATDAFLGGITVIPTKRGNEFDHPLLDDDASAEIVDENAVAQDGHIVFSHVHWEKAKKFSSGWVLAPFELAQDMLYDLATVLTQIFGKRMARGVGSYLIGKMLAQAGEALTTASATTITGDELLELMTSVDPSFAQSGSWVMNFGSLLKIYKIKASGSNDYQFKPEFDASGRPVLMGKPVLLSPSMPAMTAGNAALAFGDCSRFLQRIVTGSSRLKIANERWIESGQYGYLSELRTDGMLVVSEQGSPISLNSPIQFATMHA